MAIPQLSPSSVAGSDLCKCVIDKTSHCLSGYRIMAIPQLSKLMPGVRFSLPAWAMAG